MAKRKAVIKNIIYELDNDDIEISSEDEVSGPKMNRPEPQSKNNSQEILAQSDPNGVEVLSVDSTDDLICLVDSPNPTVNGGKTNADAVDTVDTSDWTKVCEINSQDETESDCVEQNNLNSNKINLNEVTEVDSPPSLCVASCENRIPLVTMRFKNSKLSNSCKIKVKEFIINLLKQNQGECLADSDNDTGQELEIWPEDLTQDCTEDQKPQTEENQDCGDSLFFVDTAPCNNLLNVIPHYKQVSPIMSDLSEDKESLPKTFRRNPKCFNCDGDHWLRDCKHPRNHSRIAEKRQTTKVGRYHIEDDQKYGHLTPGRISGELRHAMGLKRNEIPMYIYKMRILGYPPGWLEEARISHSGITMFDSTGTAILDPEEEDGEICEVGSKDKFDIKKILDFPGFNVPASSRYVEEGHLYGYPPMSEQDSKIAMLQKLAPNAMKAYKRKKLTFFPSATNSSLKEGQAEMDLDSGDEEAMFPSVPPLPDEAPPPLPPPPEQPPPPLVSPPQPSPIAEDRKKFPTVEKIDDLVTSNVEITSVMRVTDIPIPEDSLIIIDEYYDSEKPDSRRTSPSLDDLEKKKRDLMNALEVDVTSIENPDVSLSNNTNDIENVDVAEPSDKVSELDTDKGQSNIENNDEGEIDKAEIVLTDDTPSVSSPDCIEINEHNENDTKIPEDVSTPEPKTGQVKATSFGTPILNMSSYVKLPSDDKFSKQICDIINFENLPNSTGKYKKICSMLKKVKTEVDRIQDS